MNLKKATTILKTLIIITLLFWIFVLLDAKAEPPKSNSKFYDFNEQVIDGEIRRPTAIFTNSRDRARFNRLLRLKKSFLPRLFASSNERVFK